MPPSATPELRCRGCDRVPAQTRTSVGPDAVAFTCSRCLMGQSQKTLPIPRDKVGGATTLPGGGHGRSTNAAKSRACDTDSPGQPGIYVVQTGDQYKIGCSTNPDRRAKELRGSLLDWVPIRAGFDLVEARVHEHLAGKRLHGEWFALTADDLHGFEPVVKDAVRYVLRVHPFALRRRPPGRPALSPAVLRAHARDRKRRQRAGS